MNRWNIQSFRQTGMLHRQDNLCCQDAIASARKENIRAIALADGIGSNNNAYTGAKLAAERAAQLLTEYFHEWMEMDKSEAQMELMIRIREPLFRFCRSHGCKVKELGSTLLAAAVSERQFLLLHLGDGYLMGEYTEGWGVLSYPENGIRSNETVLTTSRPAAKYLRISRGNISDLQSICLCSDGWNGGISALEQIHNAIAVKSAENHADDVSVIMMKKQ